MAHYCHASVLFRSLLIDWRVRVFTFLPKILWRFTIALALFKGEKEQNKKALRALLLENSERFCHRLEKKKKQTIGLGKGREVLSHVATASNNLHLFE